MIAIIRHTRFVLAGLIAIVLVAGAVGPSEAARARRRVRQEVVEYVAGSFERGDTDIGTDCSMKVGCVSLKAEPDEAFLDVDIKDANGQPIVGRVVFDDSTLAHFCGSMDVPVRIPRGADIKVLVRTSTIPIRMCGFGTGVAIHGEVIATFSNVP